MAGKTADLRDFLSVAKRAAKKAVAKVGKTALELADLTDCLDLPTVGWRVDLRATLMVVV